MLTNTPRTVVQRPDIEVMVVGSILLNERAIDVVGPDRRKRADVACHTGHETGDQCRDTEAQQTGTTNGEPS